MPKRQIRIEGLYDLKTAQTALQEGIRHFAFDFNPRSFNFCQHHVFFEIAQRILPMGAFVALQFGADPDFVVAQFLEDITERFAGDAGPRFTLEFQVPRPAGFCAQFRHPYRLHLREQKQLKEGLPEGGDDFFLGWVIDQDLAQQWWRSSWRPDWQKALAGQSVIIRRRGALGRGAQDLPGLICDGVGIVLDSSLEDQYRRVNQHPLKEALGLGLGGPGI